MKNFVMSTSDSKEILDGEFLQFVFTEHELKVAFYYNLVFYLCTILATFQEYIFRYSLDLRARNGPFYIWMIYSALVIMFPINLRILEFFVDLTEHDSKKIGIITDENVGDKTATELLPVNDSKEINDTEVANSKLSDDKTVRNLTVAENKTQTKNSNV